MVIRYAMRSASRVFLLAAILAAWAFQPVHAQSSEAEVEAVVRRLFDGMRAGSSTMIDSLFHPEARLMSAAVSDGRPVLLETGIAEFVQAVGIPKAEVWDERISNLVIQVEGDLATAWMDYSFYLGSSFSHCGVNAFQLFRAPEGWRIIQLTDTRRMEGCETSTP
jgi:hypothetical protein